MVPYGQLEDHSDFLESAAEKKIYHCKIYKKNPISWKPNGLLKSAAADFEASVNVPVISF